VILRQLLRQACNAGHRTYLLQALSDKKLYTRLSLVVGVRFQVPTKREYLRTSDVPRKKCFSVFSVFIFFPETLGWDLLFFSFFSLNIMRYDSKTSLIRLKILMFLSFEGS